MIWLSLAAAALGTVAFAAMGITRWRAGAHGEVVFFVGGTAAVLVVAEAFAWWLS